MPFRPPQNLVEYVDCWYCGEQVKAINSYYLCSACQCGGAAGRTPMAMFTEPGYTSMYSGRDITYTDHATVYAPCP